MTNKNEIILDYYDYGVSNQGIIYGKNGKPLKIRYRKNTSPSVKLYIDGKSRFTIVPRLIYCVFNNIDYNELDVDMCISFEDGDRTNIKLDNLYLTHRSKLLQGEGHTEIAKLTKEEVEEIIRLHKSTEDLKVHSRNDKNYKLKYSYSRLAKMYGVTKGNIAQIVQGKSWNKDNYILEKPSSSEI